jgi:hypothetical protein
MKVICLLLLALGVATALRGVRELDRDMNSDPHLPLPPFMGKSKAPVPIEDMIMDIIGGLLAALDEYVPITNMQPCVTTVLPDIKKTIEAIQKANTTNWTKPEEIFSFMSFVMSTLKDFVNTAKPCTHAFDDIKRILDKFSKIDPDKVLQRLMDNAFNLIFMLGEGLKSIKEGHYKAGAKSFGDAIFLVLLEKDSEALRTAADFLTGLLEGLNEQGDVKELLKCVTDIEAIYAKIITALQLILKMNFVDLVKGVQLLIEAVKQLIDTLQPCATGFTQLQRLAKAIINTSILDIVAKIAMNIGPYIHDITDCITAFNEGNHRRAGSDIGDILFRLYLANPLTLSLDDVVRIVEGFLEAATKTGSFEHLETCLKAVPDLLLRLDALIAEFKQLDWKNSVQLVEFLLKLFNAFKDVMAAIKPCATVPEEIERLIQKIISLDIAIVVDRIQNHMFEIIVGLYNIFMDLAGQKFHEAGKEFGNICCIIIFNN